MVIEMIGNFMHFVKEMVKIEFFSSFNSQSVQSFMRRRRNADRSGKGLRHFSMKVCKKVEEKGTTTYNEVADELVEEVIQSYSILCRRKRFIERFIIYIVL